MKKKPSMVVPVNLQFELVERPCLTCGKERGQGRPKYCSDDCRAIDAERKRYRLKPCLGCGGKKERGHRGSRYCNHCRRMLEPVWQEMERERAVRKNTAKRRANGVQARPKKVNAEGLVWCCNCRQYLPERTFPKRAKETAKFAARCRACQRIYNHEYRLGRVYGITIDEYYRIAEIQGDRCAICGARPRKYKLAVDHDHETGQIRGLLCKRCNHDLLGAAHDSIPMLERAISYLESPPAQTGVAVLIHEGLTFPAGLRGES